MNKQIVRHALYLLDRLRLPFRQDKKSQGALGAALFHLKQCNPDEVAEARRLIQEKGANGRANTRELKNEMHRRADGLVVIGSKAVVLP